MDSHEKNSDEEEHDFIDVTSQPLPERIQSMTEPLTIPFYHLLLHINNFMLINCMYDCFCALEAYHVLQKCIMPHFVAHSSITQ